MDGFLIVDKPLGYTSRDVVNKISHEFNTRKVGHTGTLDPNASGVLIIALGKALKMIEFMDNDDKEYVAEVILGIETDTLDLDKNATILKEKNVDLQNEKIINAINSFKGKYMQTVPKYSAVKVNGRKLYEYARGNIPVDLPKKEVNIKNINVSDIKKEDNKMSFKLKCTVSKGTYIRSLIRDIGDKLNTPAVMKSLIRTKIGNFSITDSYTLDDIKNGNYQVINILAAFPDIPKIKVDKELAKKVSNGMVLDNLFKEEKAFIIDGNNNLLALYKNIDNKTRPYKVFV